MSEEKQEYKTEVEEALTMLGVGYENEAPAVIIEKPRKDLALRDGGLAEYKVWGWVKKSAKFIFHVRRLRGAKLSIWEVVSLSINEDGECALSLGDLVKLTGYSRSEVSESVKELEEMGYLSVQKEAGKKSIFKPSFAARGENYPSDEPIQKSDGLTSPVSKDNYPSSFSNINSSPSFNRVKRVNTNQKQNLQGIEAAMFQDRKVEESDLPIGDEALKAFERDLQCPGSWSWYPAKSTDEPAWKSLREFVVTLYQSDPKAFEKYYTWARDQFARGAKLPIHIRQDPTCFEYAWLAYQAANPSAGKFNSANIQIDENGVPETY